MTSGLDLFTYAAAKYPHHPGYKERGGTSQAAAESVSESVKEGQRLVLGVLATGDFTSDEIAERLGRTVLFVRPRCSELRKLGKIHPTGERRQNASGQSAAVLRLT